MTQTPNEMLKNAIAAMKNAYAPYSRFHVGACVRAEDDQLFSGCNVENASYGITMCAEANALGALIKQGHKKFKEALVVIPGNQLCPPCGACRQRLHEFATEDAIIHLCTTEGLHKTIKVSDLLPLPFGSDLLV